MVGFFILSGKETRVVILIIDLIYLLKIVRMYEDYLYVIIEYYCRRQIWVCELPSPLFSNKGYGLLKCGRIILVFYIQSWY